MSAAPWESFAKSIHRQSPRTIGETFGCEVNGQYVDLGDGAQWAQEIDGDILLIAHAAAATPAGVEHRAERSTVIVRPGAPGHAYCHTVFLFPLREKETVRPAHYAEAWESIAPI